MNEFKIEFGPYLVDKHLSFHNDDRTSTGCAMKHEGNFGCKMIFFKFKNFEQLDKFISEVKKVKFMQEDFLPDEEVSKTSIKRQ